VSSPNAEGLPTSPPSVTVNIRVRPPELLADIDRWAEKEHRTRSAMILVLVLEALAARTDKETS